MLLSWNLADVPNLTKLELTEAQRALWLRVANSAGDANAADVALTDGGTIPHVLFDAEMSFDDRRSALEQAIQAAIPRTDNDGYIWVVDVYEDSFVYEDNRTATPGLYRRSYVMDEGDGSVTLGAPVKVSRQTLYVPIEEAARQKPAVWQRVFDGVSGLFHTDAKESETDLGGSFVELLEASASIGENGIVPIKIIAPGWGSSGFYSEEVLQRDGPGVYKAGTQMFLDHPTESEKLDRPERSVRDLVGTLATDGHWDADGAAGPGIYADAQVVQPFADSLPELAPMIGISHRTAGLVEQGEADGREGRIVIEMTKTHSVDFVTKAGAGGKVLELMESVRERISGTPTPTPKPKEDDVVTEAELKEATGRADAAAKELAELKEAGTKRDTELARLQETTVIREATSVATEILGKVEHLPEITQKRLVESLAKTPPTVKDGDKAGQLDREAFATTIEEAAKEEIKYLADLTKSGKIAGMGGSGGGEGGSDSEAHEASLIESFTAIMGDPELAKVAAKGR